MGNTNSKLAFKLPQLMLIFSGGTTLVTLVVFVLLETFVFDKGMSLVEIVSFGGLFLLPPVVMFYVGKHLQFYALDYIAQGNMLAEGDLRVTFRQDSICWCFNKQAETLTNAVSSLRDLTNHSSSW
jgi:hypothetical protein